jgi:hypothetical protein
MRGWPVRAQAPAGPAWRARRAARRAQHTPLPDSSVHALAAALGRASALLLHHGYAPAPTRPAAPSGRRARTSEPPPSRQPCAS